MMNASKNKRNRKSVSKYIQDNNIEKYALQIREMLINNTFAPSKSKIKTIYDKSSQKEREITTPKFYPDQCIHWVLMQILTPILSKSMYQYNCGSVKGRGGKYVHKYCTKIIRNDYKNTKYYLKMDIQKFYPSITNKLVTDCCKNKIKDKKVIDLITILLGEKDGLEIGYYTSQHFANLVLEELDHIIKEKFGIKYYIRYIDDMVLFGRNKKELNRVRKEVEYWLNEHGLKLKSNWKITKTDIGLDFVGVRFFRNYNIMRKRIMINIKKTVKKIKKAKYISIKNAQSMLSYNGWMKSTYSKNFYLKNIKPYFSINDCKKVVSQNAKANNKIGGG